MSCLKYGFDKHPVCTYSDVKTNFGLGSKIYKARRGQKLVKHPQVSVPQLMQSGEPPQTPTETEVEVILMRTLVLQPHAKSVRRVRLRSGQRKKLVVPGCVSHAPFGLPRPELFVIRCLGSLSGSYCAVNPVAARPAKHKFDPLGVREFTWVRDLTADPIVNKMVFQNSITGQHFGECVLTAEETKALEKWSEHLGDQFEVTVEAGFGMTIRKPGQPAELFSLEPDRRQVSSFDLDVVLLTNMSQPSVLDAINRIYHVFCSAWKKERFDSVGLLTMLSRLREQTEVLDSHLLSVSRAVIRNKVTSLKALHDYVLQPLHTLGVLQTCPDYVHAVLVKVAETLEDWNQVLEVDQPLTASRVVRVLSTELADCVPLATSWWRQLELLLLPGGASELHIWIYRRALTMSHVDTVKKPIYQASSLREHITSGYEVVDDLQTLGLQASLRRPKPSWATQPLHIGLPIPKGQVDPISLFKIASRPNLSLCSEYPSAAIDSFPRVLWKAAALQRDVTPPHEYYLLKNQTYNYVNSVPTSNKYMAVIAVTQEPRRRFFWYVLALRDYLQLQSDQDQMQRSTDRKFDCVHGCIALKPGSNPEDITELLVLQVTTSRTHLYLLRIEPDRRAVLRVPIVPNNPPAEVHLLELADNDPDAADKVRPCLFLEKMYSTDPRFSHVFAFFESAKQVLLAETVLECPAELYPDAPPNFGLTYKNWRQELSILDGWRLRVSLTAVESPPDLPMTTRASKSWNFALDEPIRMLGNRHFTDRLYGQADIYFQFRWRQLPCSRIFGLWIRDRGAYVVFVLRNDRFTIAAQRPPQRNDLQRMESLVGTSMRDYDLPIMFARCESWMPGEDFKYSLRQLTLVI